MHTYKLPIPNMIYIPIFRRFTIVSFISSGIGNARITISSAMLRPLLAYAIALIFKHFAVSVSPPQFAAMGWHCTRLSSMNNVVESATKVMVSFT